MNTQERLKNTAIINSMIISNCDPHAIAEARKVLLPELPEKKAKKGKTDKKPSVASQFGRGNNGQFLAAMDKAFPALSIEKIVELLEPSKGNSDAAEIAVNTMIAWLRERSPAGSDTEQQNIEHVRFIKAVLSGNDLDGEKLRSRKNLEHLGGAYQVFNPQGYLRQWYYDNTKDFVKVLQALNLI